MNVTRRIVRFSICLFLLQAFLLVQLISAAHYHDSEDSEQRRHNCTLCFSASTKPEKPGEHDFDDGGFETPGVHASFFQSFNYQAQITGIFSFSFFQPRLDGESWKSSTPRAPPIYKNNSSF